MNESNTDEQLVPYKLSDILRSKRKNAKGGLAFKKKRRNRNNNRIASKSRRLNLKKGLGK